MMKTMTLLLVCKLADEKEPDRERMQSDCRAEYPGILKDEKELRSDSWIQVRSTEKSKANEEV